MQINKESDFVIAADIGGSHITVALCDSNNNSVLPETVVRLHVDSAGTKDHILSAWTNAFKEVADKANLPVAGLAVAMPGPFDYKNGVSYITGLSKYESIYGLDIKSHLAGNLDIDKQLICFRNDAESTIAGEVIAGAGAGYQRIIGITLGTGFGSAFADQTTVTDLNLGSDPYKDSIADNFFSTRWFVNRYYQLTGEVLTDGVKQLAGMNTYVASTIFEEFADALSAFLIKPVFRLQPQVLVVCGNIAKAYKYFLPRVMDSLQPLEIKVAKLDEHAPLLGATAKFKRLSAQNS
ncbi:ROK family protein [Mucilaginibacter sp. KACC 22063]|uniref:ROK family protein n=1 Tax=Mucilaginibacter sp. KACC 22063 TaxID=3025666 RepID=UPI002365BBD7|nr:ROK family protein [Mucilaginibacter sp. KACC 22063]WDF56699.1 ROK family protein [Mucilaginibacter sp. KACC 22063]